MNKDNFYLTTPIFYVNDVPHIGHAYTSVISDVIARYMRLNDKNVKFLTGTDEHGQKVEKSAEKFGIDTQKFVDKNSESFRDMMLDLNISYDDFIRTTENRHKEAVKKLWKILNDNGDIYLGKYAGWYSMRDEAFYQEDDLNEDGLAPTGAPVEWIEEESYFFKLSKWEDKLLEWYEDNPNAVWPESRRNEVISFIKSGLRDLSISRTSFKWGIEVPDNPQHVIYVWLDALTNYISALDYAKDENKLKEFWPANIHIVGKDILRFHTVYWPAFLMAAGIEPATSVIAHGWWTNEGKKISKSLGNVINPFETSKEFGVDQFRYFLTRELILGQDGNYSRERLVSRVNSELSNKIGNLLQRSASFSFKYCNEAIPDISQKQIDQIYQHDIFKDLVQINAQNDALMKEWKINKILDNIIQIAEHGNVYMDNEAPWSLRKTDEEKMKEILYFILELTRYIGIMLQPFVPESSAKMLDSICVPKNNRAFSHMSREFAIEPGKKITQPEPIFPRLAHDS